MSGSTTATRNAPPHTATAALAAPLRARLLFYFASGPHTATAALAALRALLLAATKPLRARLFVYIFLAAPTPL